MTRTLILITISGEEDLTKENLTAFIYFVVFADEEGEIIRRRNDQITFDEAVSRTGFGLFHYKLLMLCGWSLAGHGLAFLCPSFTLTLAACEMQLTAVHQDWIHAIMVIGMTSISICLFLNRRNPDIFTNM